MDSDIDPHHESGRLNSALTKFLYARSLRPTLPQEMHSQAPLTVKRLCTQAHGRNRVLDVIAAISPKGHTPK